MIDNDIVFDIGEASLYLRVSEQTIYKLLRRGDIAAAKAGREWRIHKSAVIDFLRGGGEAKKKTGRPARKRTGQEGGEASRREDRQHQKEERT